MERVVMRQLINSGSQILSRIRAIVRRRQRPTVRPLAEPDREHVAHEILEDAEVELVAYGQSD